MPPTVLALLTDDRVDGTPVLTVRGELDVATTPELAAWLSAATDAGRRAATVDLSAVTFMTGAGLHALCDEQERLLERGLSLTVVCRQPQLLGLFQLVELEGVLDIVATRRAARSRAAGVRPSTHLARWIARSDDDDDGPPEAG